MPIRFLNRLLPHVPLGFWLQSGEGADLPFGSWFDTHGCQILRHTRSLAEAVLKNTTPLDVALVKLKQEREFQSSDEAKMERL